MRRLSLIAAWTLVLFLTTTLTWQIVSAADDRVSDRPASPLNVDAPVLAADLTTTTTTSAQTTSTTDERPGTTVTTIASSTTVTSPPATTTTSTVPTTTSEPASSWSVKTVATGGGSVVLKYRSGEVVLQTATPAPGFQAEIEKPGPPRVEVEFESQTVKYELRAEWGEEDIEVEVSESSDGD